eukprot:NODE_9198_length_1440_cov_6.172887.p1 GENE.NODE_9198_length_1440_cov_6.172887~~NODE_9198_length_1440_cov_6.172887.p1  ORF type:complete len:405 (-),score=75.06 NODE_9198_length_1440_cov_6.172887:144-1358(-)
MATNSTAELTLRHAGQIRGLSPDDADATWRPGDIARLVGLETHSEEKHRLLSGAFCILLMRDGEGWQVQVQGSTINVLLKNLRVAAGDDPRGLMAPGFRHKRFLAVALVTTGAVLIGAELVLRLARPSEQESPSREAPGLIVAILALLAPVCALLWLGATGYGCYTLHEPIRDPTCKFPSISELGVAPAAGRMLYRIGFSSVAVLLWAMLQLYEDVVLPHLPGGRKGSRGAHFVNCMWAMVAGIGIQGVFVLGPNFSKQTLLHLLGAMLFFGGAFVQMGAATSLYFPAAALPSELSPAWSDQAAFDAEVAQEEADTSALLSQWCIHAVLLWRHNVLMKWPVAMFIFPILLQVSSRTGIGSRFTASSNLRSSMGLAQWFIVAGIALIFASYMPEIVLAALILRPA